MDSVEAKCMRSARAEHEGLGVTLADSTPIPEHTTHRFTTQEGIDAH